MRTRFLCFLAAIVSHSAQAQFNVPAARFTESLRIDGSVEDLTQVGWVFVAADGRIGITQPQDMKAVLYSAEGKRLASFGQKGNGPGEFSSDRSIGVAGWIGDKVWIGDFQARRLSIFSADGKHEVTRSLANVQAPAGIGLPASRASYSPAALATDGSMIAFRSAPSSERPPAIFVRVTERDEIDRIVLQHPIDDASFAFSTPSGRNFFSIVQYSRTYGELIGTDGRRAGYVEAKFRTGIGSIRVIVLSTAGDTLISRAESFTPVRVTQAEKDSAVAMNRKAWQGGWTAPMAPSEADAMDAAMRAKLPDFHSPLVSALMGIDNTIWVALKAPANTVRWVMLNDRGTPEFSVTLPPRTRIMQASRTTVWAVEFDADDVPSIVRFRIDR